MFTEWNEKALKKSALWGPSNSTIATNAGFSSFSASLVAAKLRKNINIKQCIPVDSERCNLASIVQRPPQNWANHGLRTRNLTLKFHAVGFVNFGGEGYAAKPHIGKRTGVQKAFITSYFSNALRLKISTPL